MRIPASLRKLSESIDVVTFAEADNKDERENMLAQFRDNGFAYATSILHDPDPFTRYACVCLYIWHLIWLFILIVCAFV